MAPQTKSEEERDQIRLYQYLKFAQKQCKDGLTVPDYNIQKEATLHMKLRLGRGRMMMILVKTMASTTIMVEVKPSNTVYDLKKKIKEVEAIPVREQRLHFSGIDFSSMQLADGRTLAYYSIQKGSSVYLVVWSYLWGGYMPSSSYLSYGDYLNFSIEEASCSSVEYMYTGKEFVGIVHKRDVLL